jgi:hypothetical protein
MFCADGASEFAEKPEFRCPAPKGACDFRDYGIAKQAAEK